MPSIDEYPDVRVQRKTMVRRQASWWSRTVDRLALLLPQYWHAALAIAVAAAAVIGIGLWKHADSGDFVEEQAEILEFHALVRGEHNVAHLSVRLGDGSVRELTTPAIVVRGCRPGSRLRVLRGSASIRVSPLGCAP